MIGSRTEQANEENVRKWEEKLRESICDFTLFTSVCHWCFVSFSRFHILMTNDPFPHLLSRDDDANSCATLQVDHADYSRSGKLDTHTAGQMVL